MSGLANAGAAPSNSADVADQDYVNSLTASNLTQVQVDALISAAYSPYATVAYADAQDVFNANQTYIDAGDNTRLHLNKINVNSGVPGLDSTGRIQVARVNVASTQRYLKAFWSPSAYNASPVVATTTETTIYTCAVSDPGYTYRLVVTGQVDAKTSVNGEYPIASVRVGSTSGQIIAQGMGCAENYTQNYFTPGTYTYVIPTWTTTLNFVQIGGGGGGGGGENYGIPVWTSGFAGGAGAWATSTITRGVDIPSGTTSITITVGAGGGAGGPGNPPGFGAGGGNTTATGTGWSGLVAAGGAGGASFIGLNAGGANSPGDRTFSGVTYVGGIGGQSATGYGVSGQSATAPGGAGGGGNSGLAFPQVGGFGGNGADGAAWIFPTVTDEDNFATCSLIPSPMGAQTPLTGSTTLYVTLKRSGSTSTVTASTVRPSLAVMAVPA